MVESKPRRAVAEAVEPVEGLLLDNSGGFGGGLASSCWPSRRGPRSGRAPRDPCPRRSSLWQLFAGLNTDVGPLLATTFDVSHDEMVLVNDIEVEASASTTCTHHSMASPIRLHPPETGRVTGLSKIARLVDAYARRPQVQERLTTQIADALVEHHVAGRW